MELGDLYNFRGVGLTPAIAMPLIKKIVADGRPIHRAVLVQRTAAMHRERGGKSNGNAVGPVRKALALLQAAGEVVNVNHGNWRLAGHDELPFHKPENEHENADGDEAESDEPDPPKLRVEREIGAGAEVVYVYYYERDRRLAGYENCSTWPCKVGFSAGAPEVRILGQGVATAYHSLPMIGLVIKTRDGRAVEKAIHHALRLAGRAIPGSPGTEWFETTPDAVRRWFEEYQRSLGLLEAGSASKHSTAHDL